MSDSTVRTANIVLSPIVEMDSRSRLYADLRRKLFPSEIRGILEGALMGNLYYQDQLWAAMQDGWPRLQKNVRALTDAVSRVNFIVSPFKVEGAKEPTPSAIDKANTVRRAMWAFDPVETRAECNFEGLVKNIVEAQLVGISVNEILWEIRTGPKGIPEYMPRASIRVPALFYRYPVELDVPDELLLNPKGEFNGLNLVQFPANKFVVAIHQGHSGHPSVSMPLRCLAMLWASFTFGLEWFATNAQLFGTPYRVGHFEKGDLQGYDLLCQMLAKMGTAGWAALPKGTDLEFITAPGTGSEGPAERLIALADRICDIAILGQVLSTDVGNSGSRALGEVHAAVKQEIVEGCADFATSRIRKQLARAVIVLNYGEASELPEITPDIKEPQDELALAQRDLILFAQMAVPVGSDFLYGRHNVPRPEPGDKLFKPRAIKTPLPTFDAKTPILPGN